MSNKAYDILKNIALIFIPLCAFISTLLPIWNVPYTEQITATLVAIDTFLGALVKALSDSYNRKKKEELEQAKGLNAQDGI